MLWRTGACPKKGNKKQINHYFNQHFSPMAISAAMGPKARITVRGLIGLWPLVLGGWKVSLYIKMS
jgi:hypothetical protein